MMSREYKQSSDAKHLRTINSLSSQACCVVALARFASVLSGKSVVLPMPPVAKPVARVR
jgi:hypothetical protein